MGADIPLLVKMIREQIYQEISLKTGWGNQELKIAIERALADATARYTQEQLESLDEAKPRNP